VAGIQELGGKTAVVTGGGSGIGAGLSRRFSARGINVVVADVEPGPAEEIAARPGPGPGPERGKYGSSEA